MSNRDEACEGWFIRGNGVCDLPERSNETVCRYMRSRVLQEVHQEVINSNERDDSKSPTSQWDGRCVVCMM